MNNLLISRVMFLLVFSALLGASHYFQKRKYDKTIEDLQAIKHVNDSLRISAYQIIKYDSLQDVISARLINRYDSIISELEKDLQNVKYQTVRLRQTNQKYEKRLDSLANRIPVLPQW